MNIKKTVKKITAVLTGATMLGATVMGAMAADLGNYPAPLIENGAWNGKVVVGAVAAAEDIAGAAALGASLQTYSKVPVSVGGGVITVEGGWYDEYGLNTPFPEVAEPLDQSDLSGLYDRTIRWGSGNVKVKEVVELAEKEMKVKTSIKDLNEDFGLNPYLVVKEDAIEYRVEFESSKINVNDSDFGSGNKELRFEFLGREFIVTEYNNDTGAFTVESSVEEYFNQGDEVTVDGVTVKVDVIAQDTVRVIVNGESRFISLNDEYSFRNANWFTVKVDQLMFVEAGHASNGVVLKLGEDITSEIEDGQPAELLGESDRMSEAEWLWTTSFTDNYLNSVGIVNNKLREDPLSDSATTRPALGMGEEWKLPGGFVAVEFSGYVDNARTDLNIDFVRTSFVLNSNDTVATPNLYVMRLTADTSSDVFEIGTVKTNELYVYAIDQDNDELLWGYDDGTDLILMDDTPVDSFLINMKRNQGLNVSVDTEGLVFEFGSETLFVNLTHGAGYTGAAINGNCTVGSFVVNGTTEEAICGFRTFGDKLSEAQGTDLIYGPDDTQLGRLDYGLMLGYGVTIDNPEYQLDRNRLTMSIPHEAAEAVVVVKTRDTQTHVSSTDGAYQIVAIPPADVGVLDREVMNMIGNVPMLVVGGPNANTVAANLLGVQQFSEEIADMFEPNKAMIKLFEDKNAILVAGYEGKDTRAASLALADFEANKAKFAGNKEVEVIVSGTSVSAINAPN